MVSGRSFQLRRSRDIWGHLRARCPHMSPILHPLPDGPRCLHGLNFTFGISQPLQYLFRVFPELGRRHRDFRLGFR